jgi:hypothetical protein
MYQDARSGRRWSAQASCSGARREVTWFFAATTRTPVSWYLITSIYEPVRFGES